MIGNARRWRDGKWAPLVLSLAVGGLLPMLASAASCRVQSGSTQVTLIELYTSEGCNSCPPADRWLTELAAEPTLRGWVAPLAFHVDPFIRSIKTLKTEFRKGL